MRAQAGQVALHIAADRIVVRGLRATLLPGLAVVAVVAHPPFSEIDPGVEACAVLGLPLSLLARLECIDVVAEECRGHSAIPVDRIDIAASLAGKEGLGDAQADFQFRGIELQAGLGEEPVEGQAVVFHHRRAGQFFLRYSPVAQLFRLQAGAGTPPQVDDADALPAYPVGIDEDIHPIDAGRQKVAGFEAGQIDTLGGIAARDEGRVERGVEIVFRRGQGGCHCRGRVACRSTHAG